MKPSITDILLEIGITGHTAQKLKDETRSFLMSNNSDDNEKVSRLGTKILKQLARDFLCSRGKTYFSSSRGARLIWPEDSDSLVDSIYGVMFRQKMAKYYHLKERRALLSEVLWSSPDSSETDADQNRRSGKKRPPTEGEEPWSPGGAQGHSPAPRLCVTRSATQPGMPVARSIENLNEKESRGRLANKRTRIEQQQSNDQRPIDNAADSCRRKSTPRVAADEAVVRPVGAEMPPSTSGQQQTVGPVATVVEVKPSSANPEPSPNLAEDTGAKRRPIPLTGFGTIDDFIIENSLHLSATPEVPDSPSLRVESPRCEPTPPTSSTNEDSRDTFSQLLSIGSSIPMNITAPIAGEDFKLPFTWLAPWPRDSIGASAVDLTGPDLVEIQTGENQFRMIDKERAPRVLQKLVDIFVDELRICRRNARQAPIGQQKGIWEIKSVLLQNLLGRVHDDEQLWKGGCFDDRAVEML